MLIKCCLKAFIWSISPKKNGRLFTDDTFKCIFINEKWCIFIRISLKFFPKCPIDNKSGLVQVMVLRQKGNKPLPEPMLPQSHMPCQGDELRVMCARFRSAIYIIHKHTHTHMYVYIYIYIWCSVFPHWLYSSAIYSSLFGMGLS